VTAPEPDQPPRPRLPKTPARIARRRARREPQLAERRSAREQMLQKFGEAADTREGDRRKHRTQAETERILKQLGIEDRRRQDRRR
jgi:hypothetical protein